MFYNFRLLFLLSSLPSFFFNPFFISSSFPFLPLYSLFFSELLKNHLVRRTFTEDKLEIEGIRQPTMIFVLLSQSRQRGSTMDDVWKREFKGEAAREKGNKNFSKEP
jgi:hypothetical protein